MGDERVPSAVRRLLNVESGLNDGIATPFVNLFIAGAVSAEAVRGVHPTAAALELVGGAALGIAVGIVGAALLALARRHRWSSPGFRPIAVLALALFAYSASVVAGTNGFIAAFVAGMVFGTVDHQDHEVDLRFTEQGGTLLSLLVWFMFGAVMLGPGLADLGWRDVVFALLALTVVRMVPVAIALAGSGLDRATVGFVGWFGPRGLASVVFGLIAVDSLAPAQSKVVLARGHPHRGSQRPAPRRQRVAARRPLRRPGLPPPPGAPGAHRCRPISTRSIRGRDTGDSPPGHHPVTDPPATCGPTASGRSPVALAVTRRGLVGLPDGSLWSSFRAPARVVGSDREERTLASEGFHEPLELLDEATVDHHRAMTSLCEELEAIDWYDQRVNATNNPELAAILAHNRDDEKEHASMVIEWLRRQDAVLDQHLRTYLFTTESIVKEEAAASTTGGLSGSLGIGSLKGAEQ